MPDKPLKPEKPDTPRAPETPKVPKTPKTPKEVDSNDENAQRDRASQLFGMDLTKRGGFSPENTLKGMGIEVEQEGAYPDDELKDKNGWSTSPEYAEVDQQTFKGVDDTMKQLMGKHGINVSQLWSDGYSAPSYAYYYVPGETPYSQKNGIYARLRPDGTFALHKGADKLGEKDRTLARGLSPEQVIDFFKGFDNNNGKKTEPGSWSHPTDTLKETGLETEDEELIYKISDKLKNDISIFDNELETLSQIEGVSVEEIKQREPMRIAKALVEEGIVDSRMFEGEEEPAPTQESQVDILKSMGYNDNEIQEILNSMIDSDDKK